MRTGPRTAKSLRRDLGATVHVLGILKNPAVGRVRIQLKKAQTPAFVFLNSSRTRAGKNNNRQRAKQSKNKATKKSAQTTNYGKLTGGRACYDTIWYNDIKKFRPLEVIGTPHLAVVWCIVLFELTLAGQKEYGKDAYGLNGDWSNYCIYGAEKIAPAPGPRNLP